MIQAEGDGGLGLPSGISSGRTNQGAVTFTRFVLDEQRKHLPDSSDLVRLLNGITVTIKAISSSLRTPDFTHRSHMGVDVGLQDDQAKRLAEKSNALMVNMLKLSCASCFLVSEANGKVIEVEQEKSGKYIVTFDALEGAAHTSCVGVFGTIFAIYRPNAAGPATEQDALQPGCDIVAAGYAVYGSATVLVFSTGHGEVNCFTLDMTVGEFFLSLPNIRVKERGNTYGINEDNAGNCDAATTEYVQGKKFPEVGNTSTCRYVGCIAADVHHIMCRGGILIYPATGSCRKGTVSLVTQGNAIAFLMLHAGGHATTGRQPVLLIQPKTLHDRVPVFIGSKLDVDDVKALYKKSDSDRLEVKVEIFLQRKNTSMKGIVETLAQLRQNVIPTLKWVNRDKFRLPQTPPNAADFRSLSCKPFWFLSTDDSRLSVPKPPHAIMDKFYQVSGSTRGCVLLVMITDYLSGKDTRSSRGGEADYTKLGSLFQERGYGVLVLQNLLADELVSAATQLARISVSFESSWLIMQSHGKAGRLRRRTCSSTSRTSLRRFPAC